MGAAGTDENVEIRMAGTHGKTAWINLDDPNNDDFEQGRWDAFQFDLPSIGPLQEAWIRTGDDKWKCKSVWIHQADVESGKKLFEKTYSCGWMKNDTKRLPF